MDIKQGFNRDGINEWKIVENGKVTDALLYTQIAMYNLLHNSLNQEHLEKFYIIDTMLNFTITNNPIIARHA